MVTFFGIFPSYFSGMTIFLNPSFAASKIRLSAKKTFLTTPVKETSPIKMVFPRGVLFFELTIAIMHAKSTPGSQRVTPRETFM